jgi:hypothetical protein
MVFSEYVTLEKTASVELIKLRRFPIRSVASTAWVLEKSSRG